MTTQPDPAYPVPTTNTPTPEQRNYMYVIYGLYALGVISFAMPTIIGAIVAYVKRDDMRGTIYFDHIQFLLRTFGGSLIGFAVGFLLVVVCFWYLFRVVVGIVRLIDNQPVTPDGWLM